MGLAVTATFTLTMAVSATTTGLATLATNLGPTRSSTNLGLAKKEWSLTTISTGMTSEGLTLRPSRHDWSQTRFRG